jgi:hypothetical protein
VRGRSARPRAFLALAVVPLLVLSGCGALSAEEKRAKRADYVRKADTACATLLTQLNSVHNERSFVSLTAYAEGSDKAFADTAKRLHDLRGKLGDAKSAQIEAFDHRIDPTRAATKALHATLKSLVLHVSVTQAHAISVAAERARRAFDKLYRAARSAKLRSCGRGGNRLADNALYAPYRDRVFTVLSTEYRGDRKVVIRGNRERDRAALVRNVRVGIDGLRRMKRLNPPSELRRAHRRYIRAASAGVRIKRVENTLLAAQLPDYRRVVSLIDRVNAAIRRMNRRARALYRALDLAGAR